MGLFDIAWRIVKNRCGGFDLEENPVAPDRCAAVLFLRPAGSAAVLTSVPRCMIWACIRGKGGDRVA